MRSLAITVCLLLLATQAWALDIQEEFDYIGPATHHFQSSTGRTLVYIDQGKPEWKPLVFVGGAGTSVRVFGLTEFARTLREQLQIRVISVERNGFGETAYNPKLSRADYAVEVREVLDHLGIDKFSGVAISGGGPYLAEVAALMPERLESLHFAAALSVAPQDKWYCKQTEAELAESMKKYAQNPTAWWDLGPDTSIHRIPGFQDTANDDGARTFFIVGQMADTAPLVHEYKIFCQQPPDVSKVTAPVYFYYGTADKSVTLDSMNYWKEHFATVAKARVYEGEGHDTQYRHWDQILLDVAGMGDQVLVCQDGASTLVPEDGLAGALAQGATLGICAWQEK